MHPPLCYLGNLAKEVMTLLYHYPLPFALDSLEKYFLGKNLYIYYENYKTVNPILILSKYYCLHMANTAFNLLTFKTFLMPNSAMNRM